VRLLWARWLCARRLDSRRFCAWRFCAWRLCGWRLDARRFWARRVGAQLLIESDAFGTFGVARLHDSAALRRSVVGSMPGICAVGKAGHRRSQNEASAKPRRGGDRLETVLRSDQEPCPPLSGNIFQRYACLKFKHTPIHADLNNRAHDPCPIVQFDSEPATIPTCRYPSDFSSANRCGKCFSSSFSQRQVL